MSDKNNSNDIVERVIRLEVDSFNAFLSLPSIDIVLGESSMHVDGIGGTTWDGTLITIEAFLNSLLLTNDRQLKVIELGCGTGLASIALSLTRPNLDIIMTDREIDLAQSNLTLLLSHHFAPPPVNIRVAPLTWGCIDNCTQENHILTMLNDRPDIIYGCEITCLRKQQPALIQSILYLMKPTTLLIFSFDEGPQPSTCSAESDMDKQLLCNSLGNALGQGLGFIKKTIWHGKCQWTTVFNRSKHTDTTTTTTTTTGTHTIQSQHNTIDSDILNKLWTKCGKLHRSHTTSPEPLPPLPRKISYSTLYTTCREGQNYDLCDDMTEHHIVVYYKPEAVTFWPMLENGSEL